LLEKLITVENVNPQFLFGVNNSNINFIKKRFPKLKIVARGSELKLIGDESEIMAFSSKFDKLLEYASRRLDINEDVLEKIFEGDLEKKVFNPNSTNEENGKLNNIILYGNNAKVIRARTENQVSFVKAVDKNDIIFAHGPAGTGKTYTAVALAVRALRNKEVKRIILTRPAVEAGESLGFLPGDLKEKIDPYLRPLYDGLEDMIPSEKLKAYLESGVIEIAPMAFMRGRTLDNCYVILDEAQNSTTAQLKMFLTRMGPSAKMIITGDLSQIDLPRKSNSGLVEASKILRDIKGIAWIKLTIEDVVRHKLVKSIIKAYQTITDSND
jgi:phosphate starvation-inducible PhoH-like protein